MQILRRLMGTRDRLPRGQADTLAETPAGIRLRRLRWRTDARTVCGFQEDVYSLNFPDFEPTPHFLEAFQFELRAALDSPTQGVFVLEDQDRVVGFLWIVIHRSTWSAEEYGYINNLYVLPDYRGRGCGKLMVEFTDRFLRERGVRRVRLTVTADNEAAVGLYRAAGYQVQRLEMEKTLELVDREDAGR